MHINERGIEIVKSFEGLSLTPYTCGGGVNSVGYGATRGCDGGPVRMDMEPISEVHSMICLVVTLKLPKGGLLGLLKQRFQKISFPL